MKIKFAVAALFFCLCVSQMHAQILTRKGHFILGTNLISYSWNNARTVSTQASSPPTNPQYTDSTNEKYTTFSTSLNVWAGYFISDRVCWGFSMSTNVTPTIPGFIMPNTTYSTFFRYYFNKPDSTGFDVFAEGNIGAAYSSTTNGTYTSYQGQPGLGYNNTYSAQTNTATLLNASIGLCVAYNFSRHWGIEAAAQFALGLIHDNYGPYSVTQESGIGTTISDFSASTTKAAINSERLSLRLHFYM